LPTRHFVTYVVSGNGQEAGNVRNFFRATAMLTAIAIPATLGLSGGQAVAVKPKPKATPQILVRVAPNPLVETATSNVAGIIQVEANPSFAGDSVTISSTQLTSRCPGAAVVYRTALNTGHDDNITLTLDNDGNATVIVFGSNCAPGSALVTADLDAPPFATAVTKLILTPPQVTPAGVRAFPNPEVEVGDGGAGSSNAASEADFAFYVETNPVYAEQVVTITSDQLTARCGVFSDWLDNANNNLGPTAGGATGTVVSEAIDNDGNAVFVFFGESCAAGKSTVIADVHNGGPTYSTQVTILPPAVTI
jgi:hypothetical protein